MRDTRQRACFTEEEWDNWVAGALLVRPSRAEVPSPCLDCMPLYAIAQRSIGKCDGYPRGAEDDVEPVVPANTAASVFANKRRKAEKMALVIELYESGMGPANIARTTGFALNTVHWYLREWKYAA